MTTLTTTEYLVAIIFLFILILYLIYILFYFMCRPNFRWCIEQRLDLLPSVPTPFFGNVYTAFFDHGLPCLLNRFHILFPRRSMMGFYYLRRRAVLLRDIRLVNQVLTSKRESFGPFAKVNAYWDPLMKDSPIFSGGWSSWTKATFTRDRLKSMIDSVQKLINVTCDDWVAQSCPDKNGHVQVNMFESMLNLAAGVSVRHGAGVLPEHSLYMPLYLVALMTHKVMTSIDVLVSAYVPRWLSNVWSTVRRLFGRSHKLVGKNSEQCYLRVMSNLLKDPSTLNPDSLLSWILAMNVPNDEAQRQVYHFFLETSLLLTGVAAYALVFLGWNVDAQTQLRREINNVLRYRPNVTLEDLARMTYLDSVIEETQRYASVMRVIDRECTREIELRGHDGQRCVLQPGDLVFTSLTNLNHDEVLWPKPSEFIPSRFPRGSELLIPFPGLRNSVAAPFNKMLLKLLLVTAVRKFEIGDGTRCTFEVNNDMFLTQAYCSSKVRPATRNKGRN